MSFREIRKIQPLKYFLSRQNRIAVVLVACIVLAVTSPYVYASDAQEPAGWHAGLQYDLLQNRPWLSVRGGYLGKHIGADFRVSTSSVRIDADDNSVNLTDERRLTVATGLLYGYRIWSIMPYVRASLGAVLEHERSVQTLFESEGVTTFVEGNIGIELFAGDRISVGLSALGARYYAGYGEFGGTEDTVGGRSFLLLHGGHISVFF